ncbi:hypothetical protein [Rhodanobacter sp. C05]|uniref:hypothetical protein n=1 Tax=Rhodanobacter sp. C05 TaxID=1945855 RepID=UPI00117A37F5|nr:hypothetical protein [Rhodanobacter sp. C05]
MQLSIRKVLLVAFLLACPLAQTSAGDLKQCRGNAVVAGSCFAVHGRIGRYFGNPEWRIWPVGTQRLLGVVPDPVESGNSEVVALGRKLQEDRVYVAFADFQVCPLEKEVLGSLQDVCIEKIQKISIKVCKPDAKNCHIERWHDVER